MVRCDLHLRNLYGGLCYGGTRPLNRKRCGHELNFSGLPARQFKEFANLPHITSAMWVEVRSRRCASHWPKPASNHLATNFWRPQCLCSFAPSRRSRASPLWLFSLLYPLFEFQGLPSVTPLIRAQIFCQLDPPYGGGYPALRCDQGTLIMDLTPQDARQQFSPPGLGLEPHRHGLLMQLCMTSYTSATPTYLEEESAMPSTDGSQILRGVVSESRRPPTIAVTSLSDKPQTITISCLYADSSAQNTRPLKPHAMSLIRACWKTYASMGEDVLPKTQNADR